MSMTPGLNILRDGNGTENQIHEKPSGTGSCRGRFRYSPLGAYASGAFVARLSLSSWKKKRKHRVGLQNAQEKQAKET